MAVTAPAGRELWQCPYCEKSYFVAIGRAPDMCESCRKKVLARTPEPMPSPGKNPDGDEDLKLPEFNPDHAEPPARQPQVSKAMRQRESSLIAVAIAIFLGFFVLLFLARVASDRVVIIQTTN